MTDQEVTVISKKIGELMNQQNAFRSQLENLLVRINNLDAKLYEMESSMERMEDKVRDVEGQVFMMQ